MQTRRGGASLQWVVYAIPGGVIVVLVMATLVILALRPRKGAEVASSRDLGAVARRDVESTPTVEPSAPPPPAPAAPSPEPAPPSASATTPPTAAPSNSLVPDTNRQLASAVPAPSPVPSVVPTTPKPPSVSPSTGPSAAPRDMLASLNMNTDVVAGTWQIVNGVLKCADGNSKNRARVRLQPPPSGEYDFTVTFTADGKKPYVAQICSFKGKQFIWTYFWNDSGLASVGGKNAHQNPSNVQKGIKAGVKYTSVVKVREHSVSAYLNGELYSAYPTDYSDLTMWNGWDVGGSPSPSGDKPLGVAAECPVEFTSITVAPGHGEPQGLPTVANATPTPNPEPAAPTVSPAFVAYKDLAPVISNPYSTESSAAAPKSIATTQPAPVILDRVIARSQPVVSEVATDLRRAVEVSRQPAAAGAKSAAATPQAAAMYLAVQTSLAPPPTVDPLMEFEPSSDPVPLLGAPALVSGVSAPLPDRVQFDLEQDRVAAWKKLIGQASQLYPKAKNQQNAVKLQLTPPAGGKAASFVATNATNKELTDVTLAVELIDATTSPAPTAVEYYFVPSWPAGQKLYFPPTCVPNLSSDQLLAATSTSPSLPDLRGITQVRAQAWSDQVIQPAQTTKVESSADSIARMELNEAYRLIGETVRRSPTRPAPPPNATPAMLAAMARNNAIVMGPVIPPKIVLADAVPSVVQAKALAQKVVDLNPSQGGLVDEAKALLADPQTALHDLRKKQMDDFVNALPERKQRPGVWTIRKPGALAKVSSHGGRESVAKGGATAGRLMLIIDQRSKEGTDVSATLFSPDQPNVRKKFNGRLHVDSSSNRVLLQLRAGGTTNKPPTEADLKQVSLWTRLLLELKDNDLRGIAEVGPIDNPAVLNVGFDPPQDIKLPEPQKK